MILLSQSESSSQTEHSLLEIDSPVIFTLSEHSAKNFFLQTDSPITFSLLEDSNKNSLLETDSIISFSLSKNSNQIKNSSIEIESEETHLLTKDASQQTDTQAKSITSICYFLFTISIIATIFRVLIH